MALNNATNGKSILSATDRIVGRFSAGAGLSEEIVCTALARSILAGTTAAAVRATLGIGTVGTLESVPFDRGGTGLTTLGAAGQVLKVNAAGNGLEYGTASATTAPRLPYLAVTGTSQTAAVDTHYGADNASLVTVTLPATAVIGSTVQVTGKGTGKYRIQMPGGVNAKFGDVSTSSGGLITSMNQYDAITLVCVTADVLWVVTSSVGLFDVT